MRAPHSTSPRRSRGLPLGAFATVLTAFALATPGTAAAAGVHGPRLVPPEGGVHGELIPSAAPLSSRLADANASYAGVGFDGHGTLSLQTNAAGEVSYYGVNWAKTVCGVKHFGLYYDAAGDPGIQVDAAGIFVVSYQISFRTGGRSYIVQAIDSSQIGLFTDEDGATHDMVVFRERVRIKRAKAGAKWCKGVHKKAFVGYRITQGA